MKGKQTIGLILTVFIGSTTSSFGVIDKHKNIQVIANEITQIQTFESQPPLEKLNNGEKLVRICKATVRGIRCTDKITYRANKLLSGTKKNLATYEIKTENCKATARGTRCMNKAVINVADYRPRRNLEGSCRYSARGSRCKK